MSDELQFQILDEQYSGSDSRAEGSVGTLFDQVVRSASSAKIDVEESKEPDFARRGFVRSKMEGLVDDPDYGDTLDVGCGIGLFSTALIDGASTFTGVDLDEDCCRSAIVKTANSPIPCKFLNKDIELDWEEIWELRESYDTVVFSRVAHLLNDLPLVLRRLWQRMNANSTLVVVGRDSERGTDFALRSWWDSFSGHVPASYDNQSDEALDDMCKYLDDVGLSYVRSEVVRTYQFTDAEDLTSFLSLSNFANAQRKSKADDTMSEFAAFCFAKSGSPVRVDCVYPVVTVKCRG